MYLLIITLYDMTYLHKPSLLPFNISLYPTVLLALKAMDQDPQFAEYAEMLTSSRTRLHSMYKSITYMAYMAYRHSF